MRRRSNSHFLTASKLYGAKLLEVKVCNNKKFKYLKKEVEEDSEE